MRKIIKRLTLLSIIFLTFILIACNKTGNESIDKKENTEVSQVKNNKELGEMLIKMKNICKEKMKIPHKVVS